MKYFFLSIFLVLPLLFSSIAQAEGWTPQSKALYEMAQAKRKFTEPEGMKPKAVPMQNGKGFFLVWAPEQKIPEKWPEKWIVSMPGSHGLVTDEFSLWARNLKERNVGLVEVQWWLGSGDETKDYLTPPEIYREIDMLLSSMRIQPGYAMLHGFSRGSANIYPVAALDRVRGRKFFNVFVANSGRASVNYPPTHEIEMGNFGEKPFEGTQWVTVCGFKDKNPTRDGCEGMQETGKWLRRLGATLAMVIEDPESGHGALHTNPQNIVKLLDWYLK